MQGKKKENEEIGQKKRRGPEKLGNNQQKNVEEKKQTKKNSVTPAHRDPISVMNKNFFEKPGKKTR